MRQVSTGRTSREAKRAGQSPRHCSGSAAIQFGIIAPVFLLFLFGIIETGVLFFAQGSLQNAAADVARMVRTGQAQTNGMSQAQYVANVCNEMTGLIGGSTCIDNLRIDMRAFQTFASANYTAVVNDDGSIDNNKLQFTVGGACDIVVVRAFYPWTIMTPLMAHLLQNMPNGQYLMTSAQAFRNEPYAGGSSC
jgi:Flp pilus assembly protein TadG